jgi:carboxymethylenebutenolidase
MQHLTTSDGFSLPFLHQPSAVPAKGGIVLVQEIFGVNGAMRAASEYWSGQGYEVVCPDLFARQQPGIELNPADPAQFQRGVALMQALDEDRAVQDLEAARQWLAQRLGGQPVSAVGYCLGGRLAVKMAMQTPVHRAVSFYGVGLEQLLADATPAIAPTLLHIAGLDAFLPPPAREQVLAHAKRLAPVEAHVYPDCDHAFARIGGEHWNQDAAALANQRSLAFLGH